MFKGEYKMSRAKAGACAADDHPLCVQSDDSLRRRTSSGPERSDPTGVLRGKLSACGVNLLSATGANRPLLLSPPLAETPAASSLQAAQRQQKRARPRGEVNQKISHRPAPTFRHILPLPSRIQPAIKGERKEAIPTQLHFRPQISLMDTN